MAEGQHRAKVVVTGDAKGATKEMDAMAKRVAALEASIEKLDKSMGRQNKSLSETDKRLKTLGDASGKFNKLIGLGGMAGSVMLAVGALDKLSSRAVAAANVQANLSISIDGARRASRGMISDFALQTAAAQAVSTGAAKTSTEFTKLTDLSVRLAAKLGTDATTAMADFSLALSRQSPMILDNLGITLKIGEAHERYAARLGKTVEQLTDAEKAEAFRAEAMAAAEKATAGVTVKTDGYAAAIQRWKAAADDAFTDLANTGANGEELNQEIRKMTDGILYDLGATDDAVRNSMVTFVTMTEKKVEGIQESSAAMERGAPSLTAYLDALNATTQGERDFATEVDRANRALGRQINEFSSLNPAAQLMAQNRLMGRGQTYGIDDAEREKRRKAAEKAANEAKRKASEAERERKKAYDAWVSEQEQEAAFRAERQADREKDWAQLQRLQAARLEAEREGVLASRAIAEKDLQHDVSLAQRRLELAQVTGQGVVEATESEIAARERLLAAKMRDAFADQDIAAQAEIQDQQEALRHEKHLLRVQAQIDAERKALAERKKMAKQTTAVAMSVSSQFGSSLLNMQFAANDAARAARAAGEDEAAAVKRSKGESLVSIGRELLGRSIAMGAMAIGDFASFNYVGGALKLAAAATMASVGGIVIGRGRNMVSEAGGGSSGGSYGGASLPSPPSVGSSPPSAAEAPATNSRGIPTSPSPSQTQAATQPTSGSSKARGGTQFNGPVTFQVTGALDRDTMLKIDKGLLDLERDRPQRRTA